MNFKFELKILEKNKYEIITEKNGEISRWDLSFISKDKKNKDYSKEFYKILEDSITQTFLKSFEGFKD